MKRRLIAIVLIFAALAGSSLKAQDTLQTLSLSVDQAVAYALEHNRNVAAARYDMLASEKGVWEAIAAGLPSLEGSVSMTNNLIIPVMIFNGMSFKVGTDYEYSNGVSASTTVFNAPYLVGIQTAKLARSMTAKGVTQKEEDTRESVMTTYYLILVSHMTLTFLTRTLQTSVRFLHPQGQCSASGWQKRQMLTRCNQALQRSEIQDHPWNAPLR